MTLRIGSMFSGYLGLDMAVESVIDACTAWVADIDPGACKVLAHRLPDVPNLGDVATIDWSDVEPVDIITGGSPCQDLSTAGRRAGMTDGTRSNLWVAMREAIAYVQPTFVVWENVRGALSAPAHSDLEPCEGCMGDRRDEPALRALGRVLGDLDDLGYDAEWRGLRASEVGACHQRFRIFVLAWRRDAADTYVPRLERQRNPQGAAPAQRHGHAEPGAGGSDLNLLPTPDASDPTNYRLSPTSQSGRGLCAMAARDEFATLPTPRASDTNGAGVHGSGGPDLRTAVADLRTAAEQFGRYAAAVARQEVAFGYSVPPPTEQGKNRPRLSAEFASWMMGLPAGWITDAPGVTRNEALKMAGNGVVPQQAAAALRDMLPHALAALREGQAA